MMREESYRPWRPSKKKISNSFYFGDFTFDSEAFLIIQLLDVEDNVVIGEVRFDPVAHRVLNESYRLQLIDNIPKSIVNEPFLVVENSSFLKWVLRETFDIYSEDAIQHYILSDGEWIVDVLSREPPEIIWNLTMRC